MDIASPNQETDQIKVVTGVPEVVFANWREALHDSGLPRAHPNQLRIWHRPVSCHDPCHEKARTGCQKAVRFFIAIGPEASHHTLLRSNALPFANLPFANLPFAILGGWFPFWALPSIRIASHGQVTLTPL